MLNAFRHQRSVRVDHAYLSFVLLACSTPFGIKDQFGPNRPGRMSVDDRCSTPFGIKDQFGLRPTIYGGRSCNVLNAFRHQRSVRDDRERGLPLRSVVLNAFRHQRSVRDGWMNRTPSSAVECSTPFGIKDQFGPGYCCSRSKSCVLNAFRHQRSVRVRMDRVQRGRILCAQRLSASKISSGALVQVEVESVVVLNAFRHQRSVRGKGSSGKCWIPRGAQRLSASKISSGRY